MKIIDFSVIVTLYYGIKPKHLEIALRSIFRNSLVPNEVILVQDGPISKKLSNIIDKYNHKIKHYILEKNKGSSYSFNYAIEKCSYDWIIKQDADDFSHKDRFETSMKYIKNEPMFFGSLMNEKYNRATFLKKVPIKPENIKKIIKYRNPFNNPTMCFHKRIFLETRGYPNIFLKEDWAWWINIIYKYKNFNIDKILVTSIDSKDLFSRRQGIHNIKSEFLIQKLCIKKGLSTILESFFIYLIRVTILIMPYGLLKTIYLKFLRDK